MGILKEPAEMVRALRLPQGFSVCELGDQRMAGKENPGPPAEPFYRSLGCGRYVAIDANGRGTHTADLNLPIAHLRLGQFDLVTDFGTGEHIFDQAQVWRTLHELTKVGGFLAFDRPCQGYGDHCFYLLTLGLIADWADANDYGQVALATAVTPRGSLVRGVFKRMSSQPFRTPQQRKYQPSLQIAGVR